MHDIRWIRENPEAFDRALARRGLVGEASRLVGIDERRRDVIGRLEQAQARRNAASKDIGLARKNKDDVTAETLMAEVAKLKEAMPAMEVEEKAVSKELDDALAEIPNLPLDEVPEGADEHGNVEHHRFGVKREYDFAPKQHFELGEALGMMDFETAAKLSGSRFVVLKGGLARLERAIGQFMLDLHTDIHGYTEIDPPLLVRDDVMFGTAQLPKFADDQFCAGTVEATSDFQEQVIVATLAAIKKLREDGDLNEHLVPRILAHATGVSEAKPQKIQRWLIPTAEVPLTNLVREQILEEDSLPQRYTALTPCFRAEAGAAGRDTRGMIRQHQFSKVELVSITTPERSLDEHERMLACAEEVLRRLGLHYRVMVLCTGDMGFASQKTYDIEVWLPGQGAYREISSCSVCGDFQARRMKARYRTKEGKKTQFVHTLNGSGVAVGRALIAVMENYQQADGSIVVPDVLQPYMGGKAAIAGP